MRLSARALLTNEIPVVRSSWYVMTPTHCLDDTCIRLVRYEVPEGCSGIPPMGHSFMHTSWDDPRVRTQEPKPRLGVRDGGSFESDSVEVGEIRLDWGRERGTEAL